MLDHHRQNLRGSADRMSMLASDEFTESLERLVEGFAKSSILTLSQIRVVSLGDNL